MKKVEEKIEIKRFIKVSFSHQMGRKNFERLPTGRPGLPAEANASRRWGEGFKKNPQPSH
jgi:hypothetical protein